MLWGQYASRVWIRASLFFVVNQVPSDFALKVFFNDNFIGRSRAGASLVGANKAKSLKTMARHSFSCLGQFRPPRQIAWRRNRSSQNARASKCLARNYRVKTPSCLKINTQECYLVVINSTSGVFVEPPTPKVPGSNLGDSIPKLNSHADMTVGVLKKWRA